MEEREGERKGEGKEGESWGERGLKREKEGGTIGEREGLRGRVRRGGGDRERSRDR